MANTYNPYPSLGAELTTGLDAIATAAPATVDDLVNAIYAYVQPIYYPASTPTRQSIVELKSVVYNIINAYNNKALGRTIMYSPKQMNFVRMITGLTSSTLTPINALNNRLLDIEDNVSKANLPVDAQTPLLLSLEFGESIWTYWNTKVGTPGSWASYFEAKDFKNYANVSLWTVACMEGALIGGNASQKGLIAPTTDIVSVNIVSALIGALAIGAGKVIFKWVPRIQPSQLMPKLSLNKQTLIRLSNTGNNGGQTTNPHGQANHTDEGYTYGCGVNSGWIACNSDGCETMWFADTCEYCSLSADFEACSP